MPKLGHCLKKDLAGNAPGYHGIWIWQRRLFFSFFRSSPRASFFLVKLHVKFYLIFIKLCVQYVHLFHIYPYLTGERI